MLEHFIRLHDLDLVLLQEVTHQFITPFTGYDVHYNIGSERRGTAFLIRNTLFGTNITRIPSGRAISMSLGEIYVVNIYAPSGTSKRLERETFFNNDLPYLLHMATGDILLGGDFNCVLEGRDSTGRGSYSRSLNTLIHGYSMSDAWNSRTDTTAYTHYTAHGAARLDRFYLTAGLLRRKTGMATVAAAFTDHLAVVLRISMSAPLLRRGRGTWKLHSDILTSTPAMEVIQHHWPQWKNLQHLYPNINLWWSRHCKKRIRQSFQRIEAERRRDNRILENFYYECIYDLVRTADTNPSAIPAIHHLNAKIVRLHAKRLQSSMLDITPADNVPGETPTLYQILRIHKRRTARLIRSVRDETGTIQTSATGIATAFTSFFRHKYRRIDPDEECVEALAQLIRAELPHDMVNTYASPITPEEVHQAITTGGKNRAPGRDGLSIEFYKSAWSFIGDDLCSIINSMFFERATTTQQKLGTIVCLPKSGPMVTPADRRPITLLNTDYKILARVIARRLRPLLALHLKTTQFCGVPGNTIFEAVATVRDVIAHAEHEKLPVCILTLDFQQAFDNLSHEYLFTILRNYGLSTHFVTLLQALYSEATSTVQINGHLHGPFPIQCGVRQGCPLSMALYTLALHPLLADLERRLPGVRLGRGSRPVSVVAYADDVTVFLTSVSDISAVEDAIRRFEKASGARLNPRKSRALAIGRWSAPDNPLGIAYHPTAKILGFQFWSTVRQSVNATWSQLTGQVRSLARESYPRDLCLAHRITYVHAYLLARIWYVAQVLPAPRTCTQQLTTAITYFIWKGATFRVPISKLQSCKTRGGWGLLDIHAKCRALLLSRMHAQGARAGSVHAFWLRKWNLDSHPANPPNAAAYPPGLQHLRAYAMDMAYVPRPKTDDTINILRTRLYRALHAMSCAATSARPSRVETLHPTFDWHRIWSNLHAAWIPDSVRSWWFMAIHDILPTNERLHRIALVDTALCPHCGRVDTLSHRLTDCSAGNDIWRWTQGQLAAVLRTHPCHIPKDWPLRPHFSLWPPQRHGAVLWILAHFVFYRVQHVTMPTLQDFADFMRRARWKTHPLPQRRKRVGGYLVVLETAPPTICS